MRKIAATVLLIAVCSSSAILDGCRKSSAPVNSTSIMFVNGCFSASSVSVKANSVGVDGASGIVYLANSGYKYVTAGSGVNLTFFEGSSDVPLANRTENLAAASHYSAFLGGSESAPLYAFTTDDLTPPPPGNAKLRFVNLSPDDIDETATVNDSIIVQGVALNNVSSFCVLKAGKYALGGFDPRNGGTTIPTTDSLAFSAGKIYTVLLTGSATGTLTNGLLISVIKNN